MSPSKLAAAGLYRTELRQHCTALGLPPFRGDQVFHWIHARTVQDWEQMTNISSSNRQSLADSLEFPSLACSHRQVSADGTEKYLLRLTDGQSVEAVMIPEQQRRTVCISTQVGCAMGCTFCATGSMGWIRQLTAAEIAGQVLLVHNLCREAGGITHVVYMGMGEPLANYDAVLRSVHLLCDEKGRNISGRRITVSTCGLVPEIYRLADEGLAITLAVSLHAPDNERRSQIMPINRTHSLEQLLQACGYYADATGRRLTFEYALIEGFNSSADDAESLAKQLRGIHGHVNIIPVNPAEGAGRPPGEDEMQRFARILGHRKIPCTIRQERGQDIAAACGQLRLKGERRP